MAKKKTRPIGRPRLDPASAADVVSWRIPRRMLTALEEEAEYEGLSAVAMARLIIYKHLRKRGYKVGIVG